MLPPGLPHERGKSQQVLAGEEGAAFGEAFAVRLPHEERAGAALLAGMDGVLGHHAVPGVGVGDQEPVRLACRPNGVAVRVQAVRPCPKAFHEPARVLAVGLLGGRKPGRFLPRLLGCSRGRLCCASHNDEAPFTEKQ